jgi:hypothetical protein
VRHSTSLEEVSALLKLLTLAQVATYPNYEETIRATMNWTVLVAYRIIDDLLKTLGHRDDPQSKTPASVVLTLWVLASLAFAGKYKHALAYAQEQAL